MAYTRKTIDPAEIERQRGICVCMRTIGFPGFAVETDKLITDLQLALKIIAKFRFLQPVEEMTFGTGIVFPVHKEIQLIKNPVERYPVDAFGHRNTGGFNINISHHSWIITRIESTGI